MINILVNIYVCVYEHIYMKCIICGRGEQAEKEKGAAGAPSPPPPPPRGGAGHRAPAISPPGRARWTPRLPAPVSRGCRPGGPGAGGAWPGPPPGSPDRRAPGPARVRCPGGGPCPWGAPVRAVRARAAARQQRHSGPAGVDKVTRPLVSVSLRLFCRSRRRPARGTASTDVLHHPCPLVSTFSPCPFPVRSLGRQPALPDACQLSSCARRGMHR